MKVWSCLEGKQEEHIYLKENFSSPANTQQSALNFAHFNICAVAAMRANISSIFLPCDSPHLRPPAHCCPLEKSMLIWAAVVVSTWRRTLHFLFSLSFSGIFLLPVAFVARRRILSVWSLAELFFLSPPLEAKRTPRRHERDGKTQMKEKVELNGDDTENKNSECDRARSESTSVTERILWGATCDEIHVPQGVEIKVSHNFK